VLRRRGKWRKKKNGLNKRLADWEKRYLSRLVNGKHCFVAYEMQRG